MDLPALLDLLHPEHQQGRHDQEHADADPELQEELGHDYPVLAKLIDDDDDDNDDDDDDGDDDEILMMIQPSLL